MAPPTLLTLPREILSQIGDWVYWNHCSDLLEFALTSKDCYAIAKPLLYRTIRFDPEDLPRLKASILNCRHTLTRENAFIHVRCLFISSPAVRSASGGWRCPKSATEWRYPTFYRDYRPEGSPLAKVYAKQGRFPEMERNEAWKWLAELMQLPALADMHFLQEHPFPKQLLVALQKRQKFCGVYHHRLNPDLLVHATPDADLSALVRSPYTFSIHVDLGLHNAGPSYITDALEALVTDRTLAPNLKDVYLTGIERSTPVASLSRPEPWKGFHSGEGSTSSRGSGIEKGPLRRILIHKWIRSAR
ncbi:hypothetical protein GE09DRAFT_367048 [Coniochaeta sp. 2T2.1]|nr:hypothetical protein GE09DRAFT_367048 [Coniochaeta sp. 2T2.1]